MEMCLYFTQNTYLWVWFFFFYRFRKTSRSFLKRPKHSLFYDVFYTEAFYANFESFLEPRY